MTPAALLASARQPDGSLQCSTSGVQSPTHARALLEQIAVDREQHVRQLEAAARAAIERAERIERLYPDVARRMRGRAIE